ncbi:MAG: HEAT repeat domain-containing protein [Candidatus Aminicenantes bacterium]
MNGIGSLLSAEPLLVEISQYVLFILGITAAFFLLFIIIHKSVTEFKEKQKIKYLGRYESKLRKYVIDEEPIDFSAKSSLEYEALAQTAIERIFSFSMKEEREKIHNILSATSVLRRYLKRARSSSWIKRFYAVGKLGYFQMEKLRPFFLEFINYEKVDVVKAKAVVGLSLIADIPSLIRIIHVLSGELKISSKYNEYVLTNAVKSFQKRREETELISHLRDLKYDEHITVGVKKDIIEACGSAEFKESFVLIEEYWKSLNHNPIMRISCVRALYRIEDSQGCSIIQNGAQDEDQRVRATAARALSICGTSGIPYLRELLYDSFYFARINSARALASLGEAGIEALNEERDSRDRFVRDTVSYMLEKAG